ncbi:MAG: hypothetical protein FWG77_08935 [Treponema sp.]|nr:hypothetical protein [Treponema sp.]
MYFDDLVKTYQNENREREMFHDLMRYRVREVLLVASLYNSFVIKQDGALSEQIYSDFFSLSLTTIPRVTCAYTYKSAEEMFMRSHYDMIIITVGLDFEGPLELARNMKKITPGIPILLLAMNNSCLAGLDPSRPECKEVVDRVFVWNGYSKLFIGMMKYVEDMRNIDSDTKTGLVQAIILVEDSVRYYSRFLPLLYSVVMHQTNILVAEERSVEMNKVIRMRWRPKILHATNYDDAISLFNRYEQYILTVISDIRYPVNGIDDAEAGFKFISEIKERRPEIPVLLQSSEAANRERAYEMGASFQDKNSNTFRRELVNYFKNQLGFGSFIFKMPDGTELSRAKNMDEFEAQIKTIPEESLLYHSSFNHFSTWLMARGELRYARVIQKYNTDDFETPGEMRESILASLQKIKAAKTRGSIPMLDAEDSYAQKLIRLGDGSIGGKGRGLAFIDSLIDNMAFANLSEKIEIRLPYTAIIGIDEFDKFMEQNDLWGFSWFNLSDMEIRKMFLSMPLSRELVERLCLFLTSTDKPLAVRSSGLFEDMLMVPFSGIYDTYIIPNVNDNFQVKLSELCDAIRLVYASLYSQSSRQYFDAASYKIEEERMAVIIQELVGTRQGKYFFPLISGTAQSYNYYPFSYLTPEDGLCTAAIGLGCHVVDGGAAYKFSPRYPKLDSIGSTSSMDGTQRTFFALDMESPEYELVLGEDATLRSLEISEAENFPNFSLTVSTFNREDDRLEAGIGNAGPRIVNFAPILKNDAFPFSEALEAVLDVGSKSMGLPVEIEFAVNVIEGRAIFYFLQLKPLIHNTGKDVISLDTIEKERCFIVSEKSMGNGIDDTIHDIIWVDPSSFNTAKTVLIAEEIAKLNGMIKDADLRYVLIGPGRWGTRDFSLGIPVSFPQISCSRVIVETDLPNFSVEPSQGSHFFHNVTSMNIGYLSVNTGSSKTMDSIDWEWLKSLPCEKELEFCKWSRAKTPLSIIMNGRSGNTVIYKG